MPKKRERSWRKLDNAAKIFPSTTKSSDTRVFRFSVEMYEAVEPDILQSALDCAIENFPLFLCVMRKGAFWYYLEQCDTKPVVEEETLRPCAPLYNSNRQSLLFRVSYYRNKINFEIYHALTDGTGAIAFMQSLIYYYVKFAHGKDFDSDFPLAATAAIDEKLDDGFAKYYKKKSGSRSRNKGAHVIKGAKLPEDAIRIVDARTAADKVNRLAKSYNASMTVFLTAVLIMAIRENMTAEQTSRPVVIDVPVNLRNYFPSQTARNFFGIISTKYDFSAANGELSDIIACVAKNFKEELTSEKLSLRMNALSALEHNPFIRVAPLPIKNFALKTARWVNDFGCTSVVSNVGRITLPDGFDRYVKAFGVFASTLKFQLCFCTVGNILSLGFTSAFEDTAVERSFIKLLTDMGLEFEITSNEYNYI